jgi:hypothetical protein
MKGLIDNMALSNTEKLEAFIKVVGMRATELRSILLCGISHHIKTMRQPKTIMEADDAIMMVRRLGKDIKRIDVSGSNSSLQGQLERKVSELDMRASTLRADIMSVSCEKALEGLEKLVESRNSIMNQPLDQLKEIFAGDKMQELPTLYKDLNAGVGGATPPTTIARR